jgi:hypothetical protein
VTSPPAGGWAPPGARDCGIRAPTQAANHGLAGETRPAARGARPSGGGRQAGRAGPLPRRQILIDMGPMTAMVAEHLEKVQAVHAAEVERLQARIRELERALRQQLAARLDDARQMRAHVDRLEEALTPSGRMVARRHR